MELRDKVAVITGGRGGIGKAMAKAFINEGAKAVVLADLSEEAVKKAADELGCAGEVCDVTAIAPTVQYHRPGAADDRNPYEGYQLLECRYRVCYLPSRCQQRR
jgi:NAD(P)-dependent dehydrogenase (short-subunit alcohol dehydrogenase family)